MRVVSVLAAVVVMTVSAFGVFKLLGMGRPPNEPNQLKVDKKTKSSLPISRSGPQPKAVFDGDYDFGRMEVGEERAHVYTIHNEGQAPLTIENGGTTCQCTVSDMKTGETRTIAPGESFDIKLTWKPTAQAENFSKGADFFTNDSAHMKIPLRILGMVAPRVATYPEKDWYMASISDDKPGVFTGSIISPVVDHFQITAVECRSPLLSAEVLPVDSELLTMHHGLCGYQIRMTLKPEMPLGPFRYPVTIKTDLPERRVDAVGGDSKDPGDSKERTSKEGDLNEPGKSIQIEVIVEGVHRGPIQPVGREWVDDKMAITMGSFEAAVGKKVRLTLFVKNPPAEGFELTAPAICTPDTLKTEIQREEKSTGTHVRYFLAVEFPPGAPRGVHREEDPGRIRLQTNHPHARDVEFLVFFSAY